jgi:hypothetical protein
MRALAISLLTLPLSLVACGSTPPPTNTASNDVAPTPPTPTTANPATTTAAATSAAPSAAHPDEEDTTEAAGPIPMPALIGKDTPKSSFPKATTTDHDCWQGISLSGDHKKDFDAIVGRCGTPTGLVEYAKPVAGHVHHVHDKRDTYALKLAGGMCYRYFAVATSGIKDLDILVETTTGALVADDKTESPVAIIESSKTWCVDKDVEYNFHVQVDGEGKGKYLFAVWARPK